MGEVFQAGLVLHGEREGHAHASRDGLKNGKRRACGGILRLIRRIALNAVSSIVWCIGLCRRSACRLVLCYQLLQQRKVCCDLILSWCVLTRRPDLLFKRRHVIG